MYPLSNNEVGEATIWLIFFYYDYKDCEVYTAVAKMIITLDNN